VAGEGPAAVALVLLRREDSPMLGLAEEEEWWETGQVAEAEKPRWARACPIKGQRFCAIEARRGAAVVLSDLIEDDEMKGQTLPKRFRPVARSMASILSGFDEVGEVRRVLWRRERRIEMRGATFENREAVSLFEKSERLASDPLSFDARRIA
jgi:hypothetical protein